MSVKAEGGSNSSEVSQTLDLENGTINVYVSSAEYGSNIQEGRDERDPAGTCKSKAGRIHEPMTLGKDKQNSPHQKKRKEEKWSEQ